MKILLRTALVLLASLMILSGCNNAGNDGEVVDTTWTMATDSYVVTPGQFTYFYSIAYAGYSGYADYFGFSTDTPLDEQACSLGNTEDYTWHDFFVDQIKDSLEELLVMCEEATVRGITLDDEETAIIEENIGNLSAAAENLGITVEELVSENYGENVTLDDIRACMQMQALASKTEDIMEAEFTFTDEDLERECEVNMGYYYAADYRYFEFTAEYDSTSKTDEIAEAKAKAKANADALFAAADDEESFLSWVEKYLREDVGLTDEEVEEELDATFVEKYAYTTIGNFARWVFEQDDDGNYVRKKNDVTTNYNEANGTYVVSIIVRPMYRDDYATRSVRHILISVDSSDSSSGLSDAEAKAEAEELLAELKAEGVSEEKFAAFANEHSMDTGSASDGGLYENVGKGEMVDAFDAWLFDSARVSGDTDILLTEYGYHIVYYVGEGVTKWKDDAERNMRTEAYDSAYENAVNVHNVRVNEPCIDTLESL